MTSLRCRVGTVATSQGLPIFCGSRLWDWFWMWQCPPRPIGTSLGLDRDENSYLGKNEFNRTYFEMTVEGFEKFFNDLSVMEAKSLTLTREVLEERKRLEALVEGLQIKTEIKLTRVDKLEQVKKILKENEDQISDGCQKGFQI